MLLDAILPGVVSLQYAAKRKSRETRGLRNENRFGAVKIIEDSAFVGRTNRGVKEALKLQQGPMSARFFERCFQKSDVLKGCARTRI